MNRFITYLCSVIVILASFNQAVVASSNKSFSKDKLKALASEAAIRHNLDPVLFRALVHHESTWRTNIVSNRGAIGLTQILPSTAKGICNLSRDELFNPAKNLDCGAKYFASLVERFDSVELGLCAYNAGPSITAKLGRCPNYKVTKKYVDNIETAWSRNVWSNIWVLD